MRNNIWDCERASERDGTAAETRQPTFGDNR